jgi:hypothetical protein
LVSPPIDILRSYQRNPNVRPDLKHLLTTKATGKEQK